MSDDTSSGQKPADEPVDPAADGGQESGDQVSSGDGAPSYGSESTPEQPPAYGAPPSYGQGEPPAYGQGQPPAYGQQPGYGGAPSYGQPAPTYDAYGNPSAPNSAAAPAYGQNPYGQNQYAQNPSGQNPYPPNASGQYAQNPYAANPYGGYPTGPVPGSTSALAIVSMILGIVGVIGGFLFIGLMPIAAIITGFIARRRARQFHQQGSGMALAGIITGFVGIAFFLAYIAIFVIAFAVGGDNGGSYR